MRELIAVVEIPKYERLIKLSNSVRPKYIIRDKDKLALKYCKSDKTLDTDRFDWETIEVSRNRKKVKIDILVDQKTGERVIKNSNQAGKSKHETITANKLHRLTMPDYVRANILSTLKKQFIPYVEKLEPITTLPIIIELEVQDTYKDEIIVNGKKANDRDWDLGNRVMFYNKVFEDVLTGCIMDVETGEIQIKKGKKQPVRVKQTTSKVIISDDHRGYVTGTPGAIFTPIDNTEDRKLIYRIYHDQREVIQNNKYYGKK